MCKQSGVYFFKYFFWIFLPPQILLVRVKIFRKKSGADAKNKIQIQKQLCETNGPSGLNT